jgi:hypothetical protein
MSDKRNMEYNEIWRKKAKKQTTKTNKMKKEIKVRDV